MEFSLVDNNNFEAAKKLLTEAELPISDLELSNKYRLYTLSKANLLVGLCGLEVYSKEAILRSFAIVPNMRNKGFGKAVYYHTITKAKEMDITKLVLLTTTANNWFAAHDWEVIERNAVSVSLALSQEFSSICPQSAVCMQRFI